MFQRARKTFGSVCSKVDDIDFIGAVCRAAQVQRAWPCLARHFQTHVDAVMRDLERDGLVVPTIFDSTPPSVEYSRAGFD